MAKFEVFGKKVFVDDKLVKAFEELQGYEFKDHTAGHLVISEGGDENTSAVEMTRMIKEGIIDYFKMYKEIETLVPEMEKIAREYSGMTAKEYARAMREEFYKQNKPVMEITADAWLKMADKVEGLAKDAVKDFRYQVAEKLKESIQYHHNMAGLSKLQQTQHFHGMQERAYRDALGIVDAILEQTLREGRVETAQNKGEHQLESKASMYEVAFAVEGYVESPDAYVGENLECNGFEPYTSKTDCEVFFVKDGRAYYSVEADNPLDAYNKAYAYFEADDFGELEITDSKLENVNLGGNVYWYEEDICAMEEQMEEESEVER